MTVMRQFLGLLHKVFGYDKQQMIVFAKTGGFIELLKLFDSQIPHATEQVIKFLVMWLQVEVESVIDESE